MADIPPDPDRYEEAIRAFRKRVPLTDPEFRALEEGERRRAKWIAGITQAQPLQQIFDALERAIRDGTTLERFKEEAGVRLAEAWGGEDAPRVEMVFRTNVLGAYNDGRMEVFTDPDVAEAFPYLRFDTVGDSRVSDEHDALDGTIRPVGDPFWKTHTPPLRPNCRCILTPITAEEAGEAGVTRKPPDVPPAEGFGEPAENWEPDLSGFDPAIQAVLKGKLDDE